MPALFLSQILKLRLIKSYMIQLGFRWVLKRGLEAREKNWDILQLGFGWVLKIGLETRGKNWDIFRVEKNL